MTLLRNQNEWAARQSRSSHNCGHLQDKGQQLQKYDVMCDRRMLYGLAANGIDFSPFTGIASFLEGREQERLL